MARLAACATIATLALAPAPAAHAQTIAWPEAIARLAAERTRASTCLDQARALGVAATDPLAAAYGEAKAEVDGVIAGLSVALAERRRAPVALPELERRLEAGHAGRERFCAALRDRLPAEATGQRNVLVQAIGGALKPLLEAVVAIYGRAEDDDRLRRDTIRAQLEATRWPAFADAPPSR
jgi:hypothetical protein